MTLILSLLIGWLAVPVWGESDHALSRLAIVALAPLDGQVVVQLPVGTMHVVRQGDLIPETDATVVQVLPDRLMVSRRAPSSGEELAWIYRAPTTGGFSRVVYLHRQVPLAEREQVSTPTARRGPDPASQ